MKNPILLTLTIALIFALTVLSLTGCESDPGSNPPDPPPPAVTLTGIMASYNGAAVSQSTQLASLKANLNVIAQYSDSTYKTLRSSDYSLTGTLTAGTSAITVYYGGKTATFTVTVTVPQLSGAISISPNTGVTINTLLTAVYSGNETGITCQWKKDGVNVGANAYYYTPTTTGNYTVTVSAAGYQSKTSAAVEVSDLSLSTLNGDIINSFDSVVEAGTWLSVYYSGGETVSFQWYKDGTPIPGATSNMYMPTEAGSYTVMVSAAGYNPITSPAVEVSYRTLTGITLNTDWVKKDYSQNDYLDLYNLTVTAFYSDGSSAAVYYYTSSPANYETLSTTGTITVTISYTEGDVTKTASFTVMVSAVTPAKTLTGITLNTASVKKDYIHNERLDLSGLVVTAAYSDGYSAAITGYTSSPANGSTLYTGTTIVTISYTEENVTRTTFFTITVPKTLIGIGLNTASVKKTYNQNEQLDLSGLVVTATYSGTGPATTITGYTSNPANGSTLYTGTTIVTISYTEENVTRTTTFTVTVTAPKTLTGITLNTTSVKKDYTSNEQLDLSGLVVRAAYSDKSSAAITGYTSSPANGATLSTTGTITVTVSYTEENVTKTATFTVTVTAPKTLTGITLNTASVKKTYIQNEQLDLSGLAVIASYYDGSSVAVTGYTSSPANGAILSTTGTRTVTVSYTEEAVTKTAAFSITVVIDPTAGSQGILYELITSGSNANTYRVVGTSSNTPSAVIIPATYNGLPVTEIGDSDWNKSGSLFYNKSNFTSITIPASVTTIGDYAFVQCTSLTSVTFAANSQLQTIGGMAFYNCTSLTSINIPEGVTTIGDMAFERCRSLKSITIPASVLYVGRAAFRAWTTSQTIYVPWRAGNAPSGWAGWYYECDARVIVQG